MRNLLIILVAFVMIFQSSCSNEVDINAPWEEVLVVFGLLNKDESTHYVRISKAYLGEGDALQFATVYDSLYLSPNALDVTIDEVLGGQITRTFTLEADTTIAKEPGIFSNPSQVLYKFQTPQGQGLNPAGEYKLRVKNNQSGNEVSSETNMVGSIILSQPGAFLTEIGMFPQATTNVKIKSALNGKLYEIFIYFKYREYFENNPSDVVEKQIEINLGRISRENGNSGEEFTNTVVNQVIYQTLANNMSTYTATNPVVRLADSLKFVVNVGSESLETYLSVNQPSNTLAQERPVFSNIENGIGLFSSRTSFTRAYYLNDATVDSLRNNFVTENLNFQSR
ncbi:MAG: DUF4249 family protein [Bacteroidia bacterium]